MSSSDFQFKFNGHVASVNVRSTTRSFISTTALRRFGLNSQERSHDIAVSVRIGESWLTCLISMISMDHFIDFNVILGTDWKAHLRELCVAMSLTVPTAFVSCLYRFILT